MNRLPEEECSSSKMAGFERDRISGMNGTKLTLDRNRRLLRTAFLMWAGQCPPAKNTGPVKEAGAHPVSGMQFPWSSRNQGIC